MQKVISLLTLAMLTMSAWAARTVTLDFTTQGYGNQQEVTSLTIDGVTVAFDKGTNSTTPKYFTNGNSVRLYGGGTLTVSADESITGITFTYGSSDGTNEITCNVGTFDTPTWTGEASEVVFSVGGTTGHRRFAKVVVTLGDGPVEPVDEEGVNIIFAEQGYENAQVLDGQTLTVDGVSIAFAVAMGTTPPAYYNTGTAVRLYSGNSMTVTAPLGQMITKIAFTYDSGAFGQECVNVGTVNNKTWTGEASSIVFTNMTSTQVRIISMLVTLEAAYPTIPAPVFDPADGTEFTESLTVTLTCPVEGAVINYVVNSEPMVNGAPSPVTLVLTETTTIMAYAEKDGVLSDGVHATYYKKAEEGGVGTLAAANDLVDGTAFTFNGEAVVTAYINGYLFLRDESGYGQISNVPDGTFENGQVLSQGWNATKSSVDGWVKFIDAEGLDASGETNATLAAAQKLTGAVDESLINAYVYVENVNKGFFPIRALPLPDGTSINLTDVIWPSNQPATGHYNIYGIICLVNGRLEFNPIKFEKYVEPTFLRGDVDNSGEVKIGDVTALINYLLSGDATSINLLAADCDQNGEIKIGDVTALINYLLSNSWD